MLTEIFSETVATAANSVNQKINRICEALKAELWKLNGE